MPRRKSRLVILKTPQKWVAEVGFGFDKVLSDWMKQFPGCSWQREKKAWTFPVDLLTQLEEHARSLGYDDFYHGVRLWDLLGEPPDDPECLDIPNSDNGYTPYPFQADEVRRLLPILVGQGKSIQITWEMGLGKTIIALLLARLAHTHTIMVICPANAVGTWEDEVAEWWPGKEAHRVVPTAKKRWLFKDGAINILSFGLCERADKELDWPTVNGYIIDEVHYLANDDRIRTQAVRRVLKGDPWMMGLTGTMVSNGAASMHNPLDVLYPGRFGRINHFKFRHMLNEPGEYGMRFYGVREDTVQELQDRLNLTGSRITKWDVRHLLPPFTGPVVRYLEGEPRSRVAAEIAVDALKQGETHISVQSFNKAMVAEISARLAKHGRVFTLTGEHTATQRDKIRKAAEAADQAFLVSTMDATRESINLTFCSLVVYAQLTNNMTTLLQNIGRYQRLTVGGKPTHCIFLAERHDKIALSMAKKLKAYGMLIGKDFASGNTEEALAELQQKAKLTKEEARELLRAAALSFVGGGEGSEDWKDGD